MLYLICLITFISLLINLFILSSLKPKTRKEKNTMLLDTSALIDGRILEIIKSGFVSSQLLVPRFVIAELQLLADKSDHMKRERARYGLSVVQELQDSRNVDVRIISDDIPEESGVDEKLVKLAKKKSMMLYTTDFNLLKVAEIEGVQVLNINELAQNLRPKLLPGEKTEIKIVQKGQERNQGLGYLDDGTLVVVENTRSAIGKTVEIVFTRNLQTTAGRMMFAEPSVREKVQLSGPATPKKTKAALKQVATVRPTPSRREKQRPIKSNRQTAESKFLSAIENQNNQ